MAKSFNLKDVVPWGRSFDEYSRMFQLNSEDQEHIILDCGGGPSSFNAEMTARNGTVVSCDPLYAFSRGDIQNRIQETYHQVITEAIKNQDNYHWESIKSPDELGKIRMDAMNLFLEDYPKGKEEKRYLPESLPTLSFTDQEFDLALSSHFLFLYTDILSFNFHQEAIKEMCRVAKEVRIFPLLDLNHRKSSYLSPVCESLADNFTCERVKVDYEFQKNANEMLKISPKKDIK